MRFWWDREQGCYDLAVADQDATVADYEQEVATMLAAPEAVRSYEPECIGCSICCGGRLPLTAVDLCRLQQGGLGMGLSMDGWIAAYGAVQRQGECVDITLRLDEYETCTLWDRKSGICRFYMHRPMICRTYTCAPYSWRAKELRSQVVNAGEDELAAMLGLMERKDMSACPQHFAGVMDYSGVLLRDVCTPRMWRSLNRRL